MNDIEEVDENLLHNMTIESDIITIKTIRDFNVKNIKVVIDSDTFDGDEVSQSRMMRALSDTNKSKTVDWINSEGVIVKITKIKLAECLNSAVNTQNSLFIDYAKKKSEYVNSMIKT
jgi:hypothetical protein